MASRPTRVKRDKDKVNGSRKPNELSSKPMRIIRGKEEVNWSGKPKKWINKLIGLA